MAVKCHVFGVSWNIGWYRYLPVSAVGPKNNIIVVLLHICFPITCYKTKMSRANTSKWRILALFFTSIRSALCTSLFKGRRQKGGARYEIKKTLWPPDRKIQKITPRCHHPDWSEWSRIRIENMFRFTTLITPCSCRIMGFTNNGHWQLSASITYSSTIQYKCMRTQHKTMEESDNFSGGREFKTPCGGCVVTLCVAV